MLLVAVTSAVITVVAGRHVMSKTGAAWCQKHATLALMIDLRRSPALQWCFWCSVVLSARWWPGLLPRTFPPTNASADTSSL
ncbi:MAG TPA: hypothetical protein VFN75_01430 [Pseudonocardiaceae bacterium]|nr:hypothetical protein [Pseudonocardiaceae bacterium]